MSRVRILFVWLVLAAIPFQGFAAASMLLCGPGPQHQAQVQPAADADHDHGTHGHAAKAKPEAAADARVQLPDSTHTCGVCASCCSSVAITESPRLLPVAMIPRAEAAEPFLLIHPRPSAVPDKPPRI